jgi:DNA-binding protein HU-beta
VAGCGKKRIICSATRTHFVDKRIETYYKFNSKKDRRNSLREFAGGTDMNKTEMIAAIAEKADLTKKDAEKALKAFTDTVAEELAKGEKVQLVGFGTFEVSERAARVGINPHTREPLNIEASKAPKFKAGKALKDAIN